MSELRRQRQSPPMQRVCVRCGHGIADQRPVFLAAIQSGEVVGPFHSGCLTRVSDLARRGKNPPELAAGTVYGTYPLRREETLPE